MTTRLSLTGPRPNISVGPTAQRTTATPARPFQQLVRAGSGAVLAAAEQAATRLPGGPILAAAVRPVASGATLTGARLAPEGTSSSALDATSPGGSSSIDGVLAKNSADNLHYLELQERISHESRTFTALSNVLKARHETVKNAIGNIR